MHRRQSQGHGMTTRGDQRPDVRIKRSLDRCAILHTIPIGINGAAIGMNASTLVGTLINSINNSIVVAVFGTSELNTVCHSRISVILGREDNCLGIMFGKFAVDGIVAHVDSVVNSVIITVEGTSCVINNGDTIHMNACVFV